MYTRILKSRIKEILAKKSILLLGPRQVGKSTLIQDLNPILTINLSNERQYLEHLKDPGLIERLVLALPPKKGFIAVDEVQRLPAMLNTVQSLLDENKKLRFALTGSSARKLVRGKANLLPGRIIYEKLMPLTFWEINKKWTKSFLEKCLIKGTLPEILDSDLADEILESYVDIYLKEEIQAEALTKDLGDYSRFLIIAAESSGQFLNYSKMASDIEINKVKISRYIEILLDTLLIYRIESFSSITSVRKARQKDRFIFFDNGVRNTILKKNKNTFSALELGPLFESWIFQQVIAYNQYFKKNWKISSYRDNYGLEIDLIISTEKIDCLIEIKFQEKFRPDFTKNLLEFNSLIKNKNTKSFVIYTGSLKQKTSDGINIIPYQNFLNSLDNLFD